MMLSSGMNGSINWEYFLKNNLILYKIIIKL